MTSHTDEQGETRVKLDWSAWLGLAFTVIVTLITGIGGAFLTQSVLSARHAEKIAGVEKAIGELNNAITRENASTREVVTLRFDAMAFRVNAIEERLKDVEQIVRPAREPYSAGGGR